ncbi:MAG: glycosyltransferase [Odoribacter sp.]
MSKRTCIIVPCYNEVERIKTEEYIRFLAQTTDIDFCFVNDGSSDQTSALLKTLCEDIEDRALFVDLSKNGGKAEAVRSGINYVLSFEKYDRVGFADADLATPLEEMKRLSDVLALDPTIVMVMGSRMKRMGVMIERKLFRHYMGRLFATVVAILFRFNAYDTQCGAKIFDRRIAESIFDRPFISKWLFDVELLLRIRNQRSDYNQIIQEIPLNIWLEQGGSKIRFSHLLKLPLELWTIYISYK